MSDFKLSAAKMAERLRLMAKYKKQAQEEGREFVELPVDDLFNAGDQAALDLYERELAEYTGQQRLPLDLAM
jgi:hypothetical protein